MARDPERSRSILIRCRKAISYSFSLDPYLYTCLTSCTNITIITNVLASAITFSLVLALAANFLCYVPAPKYPRRVSNFNLIAASSYSSLHTAEFIFFRFGMSLRARRTPGGNAAFHNFPNDFAHIIHPDRRRRLALAEIDKVPFGWYHVRAVAVAGAGFFADSYDFFSINLAIQMIGISFWQDDGGTMPQNLQTAIKAATSAGAIIGQIMFGWLADTLGRKRIYGVELIVLIVATLAQSLSSPSGVVTMTGLLVFGRVIMGLGIGGDYPMSAVITAEFAPTRWRGRMMAAVFSMQGFGQLAATLVALVTTIAFRKSFSSAMTISDCIGECRFAADRSWRIIIGFGCLPAVFALYYRLTIPETPRFTFDVALDADKASSDIRIFLDAEIDLEEIGTFLEESTQHRGILSEVQSQLATSDNHIPPRASWSDFYTYFTQYRNGSVLFATMVSWFLLDFAFYGLALNNSIILDVLGYSASSNVYKALLITSLGNLILVCAGSLPGYLLSALTMDSLGRKFIQICGFSTLTVIFCIFGFGYKSFDRASLLALYILAQFFFNFGPNSTTFVVPGECFPTRYRSICHGLSAASGKLGATIAEVIALPLITKNVVPGCKGSACSPWLAHLMEIFAAIMLCGALVSFMIPETKQQTLEVLAGESALAGTQGSRESLFARLTSSLHWQGRKGTGSRPNGADSVHGNGARMPSASNGSYASVSSVSRIGYRSRGNENGIGSPKDETDIALQDMARLNSVLN